MAIDAKQVRASLRQQLLADRMLGIRSVPVRINMDLLGGSAGSTPGATTALDAEQQAAKAKYLRELDETQVKSCTNCKLCTTRTQTVFGQGNPDARLIFVGEAPGYEEDKRGEAFVGRAGQLLTKMIQAMGLSRDDVFICNVLKCRPPNNRDPSADEILACNHYLTQQLRIIHPEVLVALGAPAAKTLLHTTQSIGKLRGRFHEYELGGTLDSVETIPLMPTYHPAYLLRSPGEKRKAWDDLKMVMAKLGLVEPKI